MPLRMGNKNNTRNKERKNSNIRSVDNEELDNDSIDDQLLGCSDKNFFSCRGNCIYRGFPGTGKCVPKILDYDLECHRRNVKNGTCKYPCRVVNASGSRTRGNCVHFPTKDVSEINNYVKEIENTKNRLMDYHLMLHRKKDEIKKWIEDSRQKLIKDINIKESEVKNLKIKQINQTNADERTLFTNQIAEQNTILSDMTKDVKTLENLLIQTETIYAQDKEKGDEMKRKLEKEAKLYKSNSGKKTNRNHYSSRSYESESSHYSTSSLGHNSSSQNYRFGGGKRKTKKNKQQKTRKKTSSGSKKRNSKGKKK